MNERVIRHEIKLQKSVIFILAVLALSVFAIAFMPLFSVKTAIAKLQHGDKLKLEVSGTLSHQIDQMPRYFTITCKGCRVR